VIHGGMRIGYRKRYCGEQVYNRSLNQAYTYSKAETYNIARPLCEVPSFDCQVSLPV
jgi:hypothetical protein